MYDLRVRARTSIICSLGGGPRTRMRTRTSRGVAGSRGGGVGACAGAEKAEPRLKTDVSNNTQYQTAKAEPRLRPHGRPGRRGARLLRADAVPGRLGSRPAAQSRERVFSSRAFSLFSTIM